MRVLFVVPFYDPGLDDPRDGLRRYPILRELPTEVRALGHAVRVAALASRPASAVHAGVRYDWIAPSPPLRLAGELANRLRPHYGPAYYQPSLGLARFVRRLRPDILHVFGLTLDLQLALLTRAAPRDTRIFVHYHGGLPPASRARRALQAGSLRRVEKALFTSQVQASGWVQAGLLRPKQTALVMETSSPFAGMPRDEARRITGMRGDPVYLSAGRLHPIKDPLTMLRGFQLIARSQPGARLYLYYLTGEMLDELRAVVEAAPELAGRVEFRGRARPEEMEAIYSSADVLIQASLREWSGLAVLEAMSCGCIPLVSRIPSFTAMTAGGRYGLHFEPGDAEGLARAALSAADLRALGERARAHFRAALSFPAIARDLDALYRAPAESP